MSAPTGFSMCEVVYVMGVQLHEQQNNVFPNILFTFTSSINVYITSPMLILFMIRYRS